MEKSQVLAVLNLAMAISMKGSGNTMSLVGKESLSTGNLGMYTKVGVVGIVFDVVCYFLR